MRLRKLKAMFETLCLGFRSALIGVVVISILSVACSSQQSQQATSSGIVSENVEDNTDADNGAETSKSKLVCKDMQVTGTRFTKKVCNTAEGWAATSKGNRRSTDEITQGYRDGASLPGATNDAGGGVNLPNPNEL